MVKKIKRNSGSDDALKRNIIIVFEVAILLTLIVTVVAVFKSDLSPFKEEPTLYVTTQSYTEESATGEGLSIPMTKDDESKPKDNNNNKQPGGYAPVTNSPNNVAAELPNPSGWSNAQIISTAKAAVNKTKAYTGNLSVSHSEAFSADVTECTGGEIVKSVVNLMIGWVVKPVNETLVYQNGLAVNSEGETVPIILPKKNNFTLTEKGVKSATVQRVGNEYVIRINLVQESVGMYEVPSHNAASIGYLDVANFDISFMEVDSADIVYKGSSIELHINADGYVTYANYRIPLHIDGSAHKGSISGSASFEGEQTEEWRLNY